MKEMYETKISDARWWAYDIPGNLGWIIYLVCLVKLMRRGFGALSAFALIPAICMLVGVAELIGERLKKLDRVLPRYRVLRGFGMLALGGLLGAVVALVGLLAGQDGPMSWMLVGGILCAVFAWLCYRGYRPKQGTHR